MPLTQSSQQPLDNSHEARRDQIKTAALKVFAQRGIAGTKMSMIAAEAGISQGLSYRYFDSKETLFTILVQEALEEAQAAVKSIQFLAGTPTEQIRTLTRNMLDESNRYYFLLLQQAQTSQEVPEKAKQIIKQYSAQETIDQLIPVFINGQQTGEFCAGEPFRLLLLYFSIITGLMLQNVQIINSNGQEDIDLLMKILSR